MRSWWHKIARWCILTTVCWSGQGAPSLPSRQGKTGQSWAEDSWARQSSNYRNSESWAQCCTRCLCHLDRGAEIESCWYTCSTMIYCQQTSFRIWKWCASLITDCLVHGYLLITAVGDSATEATRCVRSLHISCLGSWQITLSLPSSLR